MSFPRINKQATGIAALYTWLGLISIPVLTIVTVISVANVFVRGQLAQGSFIETFWAVVFAAAIEVNIVRLFFEAKLHKDRWSFILGILLIFVAGIALTIEGLQQSIGFNWTDSHVQIGLGFVVSLRVLVVVVLLAREGSRLATMLEQGEQESEQQMYACPVTFRDPDALLCGEPVYACLVDFSKRLSIQEMFTESEQEVFTGSIQAVNTSANISVFTGKQTPAAKRVQKILRANPDASLSVIASKAQVSRGYASQIRAKMQSKQIDMMAQ